jgi:small subunit ribosomal protein S3
MKKAKGIETTEQSNIKGIQVQIAGCEIARAEWVREGRVPLQTLRAKINYYSYTIRTIYGVWGLRYKNLDICRRGIVNPYLTFLYILFIDRTKNTNSFILFFFFCSERMMTGFSTRPPS